MMKGVLPVVLALAWLALAACGEGDGGAGTTGRPPSTAAQATCPVVQGQTSPGLTATALVLDGNRFEFKQGQAISITLSVRNCDPTPLRRFYRDSQRYDFIVQEALGEELGKQVWRWSTDKVFEQVLGEEAVQPGEAVTYTEVWDQKSNAGQPVEGGRYHVLGTDAGCQDEALSRCGQGVGIYFEIKD